MSFIIQVLSARKFTNQMMRFMDEYWQVLWANVRHVIFKFQPE
jgi:hypothetical protein